MHIISLVYFSSLFFGLHLAFTGRFRSILSMIRDQSSLDMITIESRIKGDCKELKILLQNCLIASRFNQKFSYKEEEHIFIEKLAQKMPAVRFGEGD